MSGRLAQGLERAGWSRRAPLGDVVLQGRWPDEGTSEAPAAPPSHLRSPHQAAVVGVRDQADVLLTPPGSVGVLDRAVNRVLALAPPGVPIAGRLILVGADHSGCRHRISAYEQGVTRLVLEAADAGEALGAVAGRAAGLRVVVVDAGVGDRPVPGAVPARPGGRRGDLVVADGLTEQDVEDLLAAGKRLGADAARGDLVAVGEVGVGNPTVAAALTAGLLGLDAAAVVGLGAGADTEMLDRKWRPSPPRSTGRAAATEPTPVTPG